MLVSMLTGGGPETIFVEVDPSLDKYESSTYYSKEVTLYEADEEEGIILEPYSFSFKSKPSLNTNYYIMLYFRIEGYTYPIRFANSEQYQIYTATKYDYTVVGEEYDLMEWSKYFNLTAGRRFSSNAYKEGVTYDSIKEDGESPYHSISRIKNATGNNEILYHYFIILKPGDKIVSTYSSADGMKLKYKFKIIKNAF